jgi:hypothetical protein
MLGEKSDYSPRLSVDGYGATVLPPATDVYQQYFNTSYRDDLFAARMTNSHIVFGGDVPVLTTPSGKFLQLPFAGIYQNSSVKIGNPESVQTAAGGALVALYTDQAANNAITVKAPTDPIDKIVYSSGYVKLTQEQLDSISAYKPKPVILFLGDKRATKSPTSWAQEIGAGKTDFLLFQVQINQFDVDGVRSSRAFKLASSPLGQSHFSQRADPGKSIFCSIENIAKVSTSIQSKIVSGFAQSVAKATEILQGIIDSGEIPDSETQKKAISEELAMSRFDSEIQSPEVTAAIPVMKDFGVVTENYVEFAKMVGVETQLRDILHDLRDELTKAVGVANSPEGQKAAEVAKSDVELRGAICD